MKQVYCNYTVLSGARVVSLGETTGYIRCKMRKYCLFSGIYHEIIQFLKLLN